MLQTHAFCIFHSEMQNSFSIILQSFRLLLDSLCRETFFFKISKVLFILTINEMILVRKTLNIQVAILLNLPLCKKWSAKFC